MLVMTFLKQLYRQMKEQDITQCSFFYDFKHVSFSVIFDVESSPFALLFGVPKENLFFAFTVEKGFVIKDSQIEPVAYKRLVKVLQLRYDPDNAFSPFAFLQTFNKTASTQIRKIRQTEYSDRIPFFPSVEEADKVYFQKWLVHHGERRVSAQNLEKTRKLLGESAYQNCKQRNISSCWTANKIEESNPRNTPW